MLQLNFNCNGWKKLSQQAIQAIHSKYKYKLIVVSTFSTKFLHKFPKCFNFCILCYLWFWTTNHMNLFLIIKDGLGKNICSDICKILLHHLISHFVTAGEYLCLNLPFWDRLCLLYSLMDAHYKMIHCFLKYYKSLQWII